MTLWLFFSYFLNNYRISSSSKSAILADFVVFLKPVLKPEEKYLKRIVLTSKVFKKELPMKNKLNLVVVSLSKINRQHIQLFFVLLSLTMLVVGAGAPEDGGGSTR